MDRKNAVKQFEALGNITRLAICELLVNAGEGGLNVNKINEIISIPPSTLSHHLAKLVNSGLANQQRKGRTLVYRAEPGAMDQLVLYLADNCCSEDSEIWG
jgi:ArsR family transcriptional regulator, arsenate/arsenite/antimonite-responsive transcriptional repressor